MLVRCSILVCALALLGSTVSRAADDDPDQFIMSRGFDEQNELVWSIKRSRLQSLPRWHEGTEEAPCSLNKAAAAATDYVKRQLGLKGLHIWYIGVFQLHGGGDGLWAYNIQFASDAPEGDTPAFAETVVVFWTARFLFL